MSKRKTVDVSETQPTAPAEKKPRSRSTTAKPKSPAATHKRPSKKPAAVSVIEETPLASTLRVPTHGEIARLAYSYWEARGRQHGFAEEDWTRAEKALSELA